MELLKKNSTRAIIAFILTSVLVMVWYGFYIIHANDYFISMWGDGFKNYFTFAYYVNFDHGAHFTGMNYPFGEHVVFTDDQPLLAFIFKYLGHISFIKAYLHGIFTILTFLSIPVCASVIVLILAEYETAGLYSILSATFITLLSPQAVRLGGHFGLSYYFFIPLSFLLLIRMSRTKSDKYLLLFPMAVTVFGLIHFYHLAMISFFGLMYAVFYFLISERKRNDLLFFGKQIVASILPFLLIRTFLFLTDTVTDRPDNPWGFFDSSVTYDTVFIAPYSFVFTLLAKFIAMPASTGERWAYIGVVADLVLIFFIVSSLLKFSLTKRILRNLHPSLLAGFAASIILLLFSFGLPFAIHGLKWMFDHTGPLRQFRAPCRFAWVFYYVGNIFVTIYAGRLLIVLDTPRWLKYTLAISMFTLWFIDLNIANNKFSNDFSLYRGKVEMKIEQERMNQLLTDKGFATKDFQALLYLPYFTTGSEKTTITWGGDVMGMKVALYTGLKMIDADMSRTSLSQVNMNVQLISSALLHKDVLKLYPSHLPLLVAYAIDETITPNERALIKKGSYIGSTYIFPDTIRFYSLPLEAFDDTAALVRSRLPAMLSDMTQHTGYLSSDTAHSVVVNGYDDRSAPFTRFGKGALYFESRDTVIYAGTLPGAKDSSRYEFSIWNYSDHRIPAYPWYEIKIFDQKNNQIADYQKIAGKSTDVFENWVRTNIEFTLPSKDDKITIDARGKMASYDELMIRPVNLEVLTHYTDKELFMYNNYPIKR